MKKQIIITGLIGLMIITSGVLLFLNQETDETKGTYTFSDACAALNGSNFRSKELLGIGLGAEGEILGYWSVSFSNGTFMWSLSDFFESGTYECDEWNITLYSIADAIYIGRYNPNSNILILEEKEYEIV